MIIDEMQHLPNIKNQINSMQSSLFTVATGNIINKSNIKQHFKNNSNLQKTFSSIGGQEKHQIDVNLEKMKGEHDILRQLILKSNVAVYSVKNKFMHFSLPQEFVENSSELNSLTVSIPVTADRLINDHFLFNNEVWDEIEKILESEESIGLESMRPANKAIQWILSCTKEEGSQLYTMMTPTEWSYQLDPKESVETLKSIKENIVNKK